jgi:hypothetical protein
VRNNSGGGTYIPSYKSAGYWSLFNSPNRIKVFQELFRTDISHKPVFLRGPKDFIMYRGVMILSLFGIGATLYGFGLMATGKMQKKQ